MSELVEYRRLFEEDVLPRAVVDARAFRFLRVNAALCRLLEQPRETLLAQTLIDFVPLPLPLDGEQWVTEAELSREGDPRWLELHGQLLGGEDEEPRWTLTLQDVTARRRAALQEHERNERLERLLQQVSAAVVYVNADERYLFSNLYYETHHGRRRSDILGRTVREALGDRAYANVAPHVQAVLSGKTVSFETVIERKELDPIYVSATYVPDFGPDGAVRGFTALSEDITERKQVELALRESELRFRQLAEAIPQIVYTNDDAGRSTYMNQRWSDYTGLSVEHYKPDARTLAIHPDDLNGMLSVWAEAAQEKKPYELRFRLRRHDGVYRWFLTRSVPLFGSAGTLTGWFGTSTDIHEEILLSQALAESKERLEIALRGITDAFILLDREWRVLFVNEQWARLASLRPEQCLGKSIWKLFPGSVGSHLSERLHMSLEQQQSLRFEYLSQLTGRWVEVRAYPTAQGISVFTTDIHEQKLAQAAAENERRWLEAVLDFIPVPLSFREPGTGQIFFSNKAANEMAGGELPTGALLGGDDGTFWLTDDLERPVPHDKLPGVRLARGEELRNAEVVWHTPTGRFPVLVNGGTLPAMHGHPTTVVVTTQDISELRQVEQELRRTADELEMSLAVLDSFLVTAPVGMAFLDRKRRYVRVNDELAKINGSPAEAMLGKRHEDVVPSIAREVVPLLEHVLATGEPILAKELQGETPSAPGKRRSWLASYYPVRSPRVEGGAILGIGVVVVEITAQKETQQKLEEAVRARDLFLSVASHELRTPITAMKLQTQLMRNTLAKGDPRALAPERVAKLLAQTDRSLLRLGRLVDDMLDIARIQSGRLTIRRERDDLTKLAEEVLERFESELASAGIAATVEAGGPVEVAFDRVRLEQVLTNLVTNAIRYAPGGPLTVRIEPMEARVLITVRDSGPGIAPEHREKIFERFERLVSASEVSGLGLGLYIVREIVRAHGGDIRVESEPGQGAAFVVELPLEEARSA